ncbi:MAG: bifunctional methionine sulfoxide reductase B/A protein [Candidatus Moranbacteria bacterium]|nr:bifunctional methionine sulfoxide reductase B/A protein [Candidatus Moranbacteria bacterium]
MKLNKLSPEEKRIIEDKKTEPPFSGEYENFYKEGVFVCRRCGAVLYRSEDKFDAHCGWPSFDREVPGAVKRSPDADGLRTEITCARCGAHLGHVFLGEKLTEADTRHCVNSLSMKFTPKDAQPGAETAYFGSGCFWCAEAVFRMIRGVLSVTPGYAGGAVENPTYEDVSTGTTGHAEVVRVEFDPTRISYEALLNVFFATHDPTTLDRQGNDVGPQYRSIILAGNETQFEIAQKTITDLEEEKVFASPIVTQVVQLSGFYEAEEYHKNYFQKNPNAAYCQSVISPKISKMRAKFSALLSK